MSFFRKRNRLGKSDGDIKLVTKDSSASILTEQFRTVQTNIEFANANNQLRSLMITSDRPSQGKSTISSNLAVTCAQHGQKVILIDADMRRPVAHNTFDLKINIGLSTCLSNMNNVKDSVQDTDIDNLSVMTGGPIPPNPSQLLSGQRFNQILNQLYQSFDLVILDTPPIHSASDASVLSTKIDGTVMVIPQSVAEKKSVLSALNQLKTVHANILGAIMNNFTDKDVEDYYYYYNK